MNNCNCAKCRKRISCAAATQMWENELGYLRRRASLDKRCGRGCCSCLPAPDKVHGRFGIAWVTDSPNCTDEDPTGWQVEFYDTPSRVCQKCQDMVDWVNNPPLPKLGFCVPPEFYCNTFETEPSSYCCSCKKCCEFNPDYDHEQRLYCEPPRCNRLPMFCLITTLSFMIALISDRVLPQDLN